MIIKLEIAIDTSKSMGAEIRTIKRLVETLEDIGGLKSQTKNESLADNVIYPANKPPVLSDPTSTRAETQQAYFGK